MDAGWDQGTTGQRGVGVGVRLTVHPGVPSLVVSKACSAALGQV